MLATRSLSPSAPASLEPCLAELLRTKYCRSNLILHVARILTDRAGLDKQAYRLLLSDGERVIQTVFNTALHPLIAAGEASEGSVIVLEDYEVAKAKRLDGNGYVLYLAVAAFRNASHEEAAVELETRRANVSWSPSQNSLGSDRDNNEIAPPRKKRRLAHNANTGPASEFVVNKAMSKPRIANSTNPSSCLRALVKDDEEEDDFETAEVDLEAVQNRRRALRELRSSSHNRRHLRSSSPIDKEQQEASFSSVHVLKPVNQTLNLHTLHSLLYILTPVQKRNYLCDVFAVITWVSPSIVKRPSMPPKRHLKIRDPTIAGRASDVSVSVFVGAATFVPIVGTVALFRNLTAQAWDGVILNAYEKDCKGVDWFVTDPDRLPGLDFAHMLEWWKGQRRNATAKDS